MTLDSRRHRRTRSSQNTSQLPTAAGKRKRRGRSVRRSRLSRSSSEQRADDHQRNPRQDERRENRIRAAARERASWAARRHARRKCNEDGPGDSRRGREERQPSWPSGDRHCDEAAQNEEQQRRSGVPVGDDRHDRGPGDQARYSSERPWQEPPNRIGDVPPPCNWHVGTRISRQRGNQIVHEQIVRRRESSRGLEAHQQLDPPVDPQLVVDVGQMRPHGCQAHRELFGDFCRSSSRAGLVEHLALGPREARQCGRLDRRHCFHAEIVRVLELDVVIGTDERRRHAIV